MILFNTFSSPIGSRKIRHFAYCQIWTPGSIQMERKLLNMDRVGTSEPLGRMDALETLEQKALTPREVEVLEGVARGKPNNEIGLILQIRPRTVSKHLEHIYTKLGVESRTAAVLQFLAMMQQNPRPNRPLKFPIHSQHTPPPKVLS